MKSVLVRRLAGSCAVLVAASVAVGSVARPGPSATVASGQRPALTDDDGGQALFDVPALAPGTRVERCIRIKREDGLGRVELEADPRGPLASSVSLAVARGEGGGYGDCDTFKGKVVYRGTLADAATGLQDAGWGGSGAGQATYRFVLRAPADLSPDAGRAQVAFHWTAAAADETRDAGEQGGGDPAGTPDASPTVVAGAAPPSGVAESEVSPAEATGPPAETQGTRGDRSSHGRDKHRGKDTKGTADRATAEPPARAGDNGRPGLGATLRKMVAAVARAAVEGAKRVAFPTLLLIAMGLFMLFQNRLDGRDPKLALAPVHGSPDLAFPDPDADGEHRS